LLQHAQAPQALRHVLHVGGRQLAQHGRLPVLQDGLVLQGSRSLLLLRRRRRRRRRRPGLLLHCLRHDSCCVHHQRQVCGQAVRPRLPRRLLVLLLLALLLSVLSGRALRRLQQATRRCMWRLRGVSSSLRWVLLLLLLLCLLL
jgi:hypothetical protein